MDDTEIAMHITYETIWNFHLQLKRKGVRLKAVTEFTGDNVSYAKKLTELFELRHLTGVRSNFAVVDRRECLLHSISHEDQPLSHAIISNAKPLVEAQYFLFQTLWNQSIPAEDCRQVKSMNILCLPVSSKSSTLTKPQSSYIFATSALNACSMTSLHPTDLDNSKHD